MVGFGNIEVIAKKIELSKNVRSDNMALINCPECTKEISDKVKFCPHCGYPFEEDSIQGEEIKPQQVELTGVKISGVNYKKTALFIIVGLILIAGTFLGVKMRNERVAELAYKEEFNGYIDKLNLVQFSMLSGGSDAEGLCNLAARVWYNTIYKEYDSTTDKFTRKSYSAGYTTWVSDFNEALANLYDASTTKSTIVDIESNQILVKDMMKELQNPPEGLEKCYETVTELYTAYKGLTDLAISPTGSLTSFSESRNTKISNFMDLVDKLSNQIPEKFEIDSDKK